MTPAFRLLSKLEAVDLCHPDGAEERLRERGEYLKALAAFDMSELDESERKEIRRRLQRVIQGDADLILEARAAMREIDQGRRNATRGRAAARGYRAANPRIEPALNHDA